MLPRLILSGLVATAVFAAAPDGASLYQQKCAGCHESKAAGAANRMPTREAMAARSPEEIIRALTAGAMVQQAAGLTEQDVRSIASYVTGKALLSADVPSAGLCSGTPKAFSIPASDAGWNGWGGGPGQTRYQSHPGFTAADVPRLKLKWAFAFPNASVAYAQPAVVGGRVFVGGVNGTVYSLDAATGCTYWSYPAASGVRSAVSVGRLTSGRYAVYFGDLQANVHAVDAVTGKLLWKVKVDEHPVARITGAPILYKDRLYVPVSSVEEASAMSQTYECCKFRGNIVALDAATGKEIWKTYGIADAPKPYRKAPNGTQLYGPAGGAIWSAPTIDAKRKLLYAATGNSYTDVENSGSDAILAIDLESGKLVWSQQMRPKDNFTMACGGRAAETNCPHESGPDYDFGSSPILRTLSGGKDVLIAAAKSAIVYALDPEQRGKLIWEQKVGQGGPLGGVEWGPTADEQNVYVAVSDLFQYKNGVPGGLHALQLATGEKLWSKMPDKKNCVPIEKGCTGAQSAAISSMPGVVFSGGVDAHLRAYATSSGEILWDFDANREFPSVNGVKAKGGSFDAAGPVIAGRMLFTNSGYGQWQGIAGNTLLVFSVDGK